MSEGLIDATNVESEGDASSSEPTWYWDENTPGTGDRPEWLKEKYTKVTDQAKAYIEAEKYVGKKNVPESYDFSDYSDYFDTENDYFKQLSENAKQYGLSQDGLKALIDPIIQYQDSTLPDPVKEIEKLGEKAQQKIDTVNTWVSNVLSPQAIETIGKISNRAEVVELFDEIRQKFIMNKSQPPGSTQQMSKQPILTEADVRAEMSRNYARYKTDASYRAEISEKFRQALGDV